ncbi:MAG: hypothetical protein NC224_12330 [Bacteroides sp.]|nr:hypothetical protein [Bacteroides sp.]
MRSIYTPVFEMFPADNSNVSSVALLSGTGGSVSGTVDSRQWFVMTSPNPEQVETCLVKENGCRHSPFLYFIPYRFLERRIADDVAFDDNDLDDPNSVASVRENNALRATLRRYIFIKAEAKELDMLLTSSGTKDAFRTLWWVRDRQGNRLVVPSAEMEQFINVCCDIRVKFEICPSSSDLEKNEPVRLRVEGFEGHEAWVMDIRQRGGKTEYVCGFHILAGTAMLRLKHLTDEDIARKPDKSAGSRENNNYRFVEDVQRKLFAVMEHRLSDVDGSGKFDSRDRAVLDVINNYRYRKFSTLTLRAKHCALMLLGASLCGDSYGVRQFVRMAGDILAAVGEMPEGKRPKDAVAYLKCAIYMATGELFFYEETKKYFISLDKHSATWLSLTRFMDNRERLGL